MELVSQESNGHRLGRFLIGSLRIALLFSIVFLLPSCKWVRGFFAEKQEPFDPCDPYYDYYEKGKHFIHDEMIREDGTIDYRRIFKGLDPGYTRCDPLARPKEPRGAPVELPKTSPEK